MSKKNIPIKPNETYTLTIRDLGIHGEGIGAVDDFTVFVPGALPGETIQAMIVTAKNPTPQGVSFPSRQPPRIAPRPPAQSATPAAAVRSPTSPMKASLP